MRARTLYVNVVILLTAVLLTGCAPRANQAAEQQAVEPPAAEQPAEAIAPEAKAHLDEVLELMQTHSINRLKIDWNEFRAQVFAKAAGAKSVEETRPAIREALTLLADGHSHYQPKFGGTIAGIIRSCSSSPVSTPELPRTVGYIPVRAFSGTATEAAAYSESIRQTISAGVSQGVTAWIVDLRRNMGGNMWPMITGLSPLLGEGPLGSFIDPAGAAVVWEIRDGHVYYDGQAMPFNIEAQGGLSAAPRVAVLTDAMTASSGEAVAIAFRGRSATRAFGTPTCGLSTANRGFPLSDGGMLVLTVSVMADRTGTPYGGPVVPDEVIEDPDTVVKRALEWLNTGN